VKTLKKQGFRAVSVVGQGVKRKERRYDHTESFNRIKTERMKAKLSENASN